MWAVPLILASLGLIARGLSAQLHNGTYSLPGGLTVIRYGAVAVAEFNVTAGLWHFNVTAKGPVVVIVGSSGVDVRLVGIWYTGFSSGLTAYSMLCLNTSAPPTSLEVWQGTTPVEVPGLNLSLESSPSSCGEQIVIDGNSTEFSYLTYFTQDSWTSFDIEGRNWSVVLVLGEAFASLPSSNATHIVTVGLNAALISVSSPSTYVPLIISTVALALALVAEIDGRGGGGVAQEREAGAHL